VLTHPCPESQHGHHLASIVTVFIAVGALSIGVRGNPAEADDDDLQRVVQAVCQQVTDLEGLIGALQDEVST